MSEELSRLSELVDQMMTVRDEVASAELTLATLQAKAKDLEEIQIAGLMEAIGIDSIKTASGVEVTLQTLPKPSITEEKREQCMNWLESHGHGGLIKRVVAIAFNREQEAEAKALISEIRPKYAGVVEKKDVHASTLAAWVKNQLAEGAEIPLELFSVHFVKKINVKTK